MAFPQVPQCFHMTDTPTWEARNEAPRPPPVGVAPSQTSKLRRNNHRIEAPRAYPDPDPIAAAAQHRHGGGDKTIQPPNLNPSPHSARTNPAETHPPAPLSEGARFGIPEFSTPTTSVKASILLCLFSPQTHNCRQHRINVSHPSIGIAGWNDQQLFTAFRTAYNTELRSFWQRFFSLRGLKYITVLEYTVAARPVRVKIDSFARSDLMYAFQNLGKIVSKTEWVEWVFKLKANKEKKYALEFVEGWKGGKIMALGAVPWVGSVLMAFIWSVSGGNVQTAFAVAPFILAASGGVLALLAILSSLEG